MPIDPPPLRVADQLNFDTMVRAANDGALTLVSAIRKPDQRPVALICALQANDDATVSVIPFARMLDGNPYELFEDPTQ